MGVQCGVCRQSRTVRCPRQILLAMLVPGLSGRLMQVGTVVRPARGVDDAVSGMVAAAASTGLARKHWRTTANYEVFAGSGGAVKMKLVRWCQCQHLSTSYTRSLAVPCARLPVECSVNHMADFSRGAAREELAGIFPYPSMSPQDRRLHPAFQYTSQDNPPMRHGIERAASYDADHEMCSSPIAPSPHPPLCRLHWD